MGIGKLILRATIGGYFFGHGMQKLTGCGRTASGTPTVGSSFPRSCSLRSPRSPTGARTRSTSRSGSGCAARW